jgi:hypothetical protein
LYPIRASPRNPERCQLDDDAAARS